MRIAASLALVWLAGCADLARGKPQGRETIAGGDAVAADAADVPDPGSDAAEVDPDASVTISVSLDGVPVAGARVTQGGSARSAVTGPDGRVAVQVDRRVAGEIVFMASVPEARIQGGEWRPGTSDVAIALTRYDPADNPSYLFQDPGEPARRDNTGQCAHCHVTINADWYASPHRSSATNPTLRDLYEGNAVAYTTAADCGAAGGRWVAGDRGKAGNRCVLGASVLAALNPDSCADGDCSGTPTAFGACADCHAPGIDGALGGRDLRTAAGYAKDYGVHCDVCHKVEAIDPAAPPGVGGRLVMHRPSERSSSIGLGTWQPLTFGPHHDVPNPRMGNVQRDLFSEATLCAGCHQYEARAPGVDAARWPGGLPIHSTWAEWLASPKNPDTPCQGCHMPPDTEVLNAADLQLFGGDGAAGVAAGWRRPPGSVKRHAFVGPRTRSSQLLESAASITIDKTVAGARVTALVTVSNVFPGHALPTGEPLRAMVLLVEARCDGASLDAIGGDAVPDFGGALARKLAGDDWTRWPGAQAGEVLRVVQRLPGFYDYDGFGRFARGSGTAAERGMPIEHVVGAARILAVAADGTVTLDRPLPVGDLVYRGAGDALPEDGAPASARAGAPGFGFARVLVDAAGARMVPHFLAVDLASDNRLLPGASWTSEHVFAATCADPIVSATLVHRAYPLGLARERGWTVVESVMRTATR